MSQLSLHSPLGDLTLCEEDDAIVAIDWAWRREQTPTPLLKRAAAQLAEYFAGDRIRFDLPLRPAGSDFQRSVWREMMKIPYGKVRTYGTLAKRLEVAAQAVGTACGRNPIPIIIPCHRVVGANGWGGYSGRGGLKTKRKLLACEGSAPDLFAGA